MSMNIKQATLKREGVFKRLGVVDYKSFGAGDRCWYTRSPVEPGTFVIWADRGLRWYIKIPAIQLQDYIKEGA